MNLRKLEPKLQEALVENNFLEANIVQQETFSSIKSGVDVLVAAEKSSGKTTTLAISVIQQLKEPFEESPRALVFAQNKEKALELKQIFEDFSKYNNLRIFAVHDKTDIDEEKNQISLGIDVLIGTPKKLNILFSSAGYNLNKVKIFVIDDLDLLLQDRAENVIYRLCDSINKLQKVFFCTNITNKVEILTEKIMIEPQIFEL